MLIFPTTRGDLIHSYSQRRRLGPREGIFTPRDIGPLSAGPQLRWLLEATVVWVLWAKGSWGRRAPFFLRPSEPGQSQWTSWPEVPGGPTSGPASPLPPPCWDAAWCWLQLTDLDGLVRAEALLELLHQGLHWLLRRLSRRYRVGNGAKVRAWPTLSLWRIGLWSPHPRVSGAPSQTQWWRRRHGNQERWICYPTHLLMQHLQCFQGHCPHALELWWWTPSMIQGIHGW